MECFHDFPNPQMHNKRCFQTIDLIQILPSHEELPFSTSAEEALISFAVVVFFTTILLLELSAEFLSSLSIPTGQRKFWKKKSTLTWLYVLAAIYLHLGLLCAALRWILCANRDQQGHRGLPRSTKDSQIHILCGRRYQDNKYAWNAAQTSQKLGI